MKLMCGICCSPFLTSTNKPENNNLGSVACFCEKLEGANIPNTKARLVQSEHCGLVVFLGRIPLFKREHRMRSELWPRGISLPT